MNPEGKGDKKYVSIEENRVSIRRPKDNTM